VLDIENFLHSKKNERLFPGGQLAMGHQEIKSSHENPQRMSKGEACNPFREVPPTAATSPNRDGKHRHAIKKSEKGILMSREKDKEREDRQGDWGARMKDAGTRKKTGRGRGKNAGFFVRGGAG